jgi:hypothetical protein
MFCLQNKSCPFLRQGIFIYVGHQCLLFTTGGKDEPNVVVMRRSQQTSHHQTQNIKTHNRTTQKTKIMSNTDPTNKQTKNKKTKTGGKLWCSRRQKLLKQGYVVPRLKSSLQKLHNLIDRYEISIIQMTMDLSLFT